GSMAPVSFVRISPAECRSAFSAAVCCPGVPITVTYTSATDKSGETFTRVMLGRPVRRGSFSSCMMICASSCWIVEATLSVRLDIQNRHGGTKARRHEVGTRDAGSKCSLDPFILRHHFVPSCLCAFVPLLHN